tara:strand:- start:213 stop:830 length:618 start_codon:yes stop_codon:yes gene_type:complete
MKEGKESASHFYAKYALAKMLDEIHKNDNCFHVVEYPIIEELETNAFDEFYSIRKKDNAVMRRPDYDCESGNYEGVNRIYPGIMRRVNKIYPETDCPWPDPSYVATERFDNYNMPTLQNYIDGKVKVKYFVDVAQIWKGILSQCFEIKSKSSMTAEKSDHLCWLADNVYEVPSKYILGFDVRKPNLAKLKHDLSFKYAKSEYTRY